MELQYGKKAIKYLNHLVSILVILFRRLPQFSCTEGARIPINRICGNCRKICWKEEDKVSGRIWSPSFGYSCGKCRDDFNTLIGKPIMLETLDGDQLICAKFLLERTRGLSLEHNKIYAADELGLSHWLVTQKG